MRETRTFLEHDRPMHPPARLIAFYLPQFHPIPENDEWWGNGFTEWTNVARAQRRFPGHYQPHVPADLGFYDLRVPETRQAQADLARAYGVEAFCYYHYWFAGRRILQRPFEEVLASKKPDFPFCLCWANESWTGHWHGAGKRMLIEQTYPGPDDHERHFETLLPAFLDQRYVRVEGKPLFLVYRPDLLEDRELAIAQWRSMARAAGLNGLHLVAVVYGTTYRPRELGFDAAAVYRLHAHQPWMSPTSIVRRSTSRLLGIPSIYSYRATSRQTLPQHLGQDLYPTIIPNWDNSPRLGKRGLVLHGSSPELFRAQLRQALRTTTPLPRDSRLIFVKSWNEWAEGNHLEPDLRFGRAYLEALRDELAAAAESNETLHPTRHGVPLPRSHDAMDVRS